MRAEGGDRLILLVTIEALDLTGAILFNYPLPFCLGGTPWPGRAFPCCPTSAWTIRSRVADRDGFYARPPSPSRRYGASLCPCSKYIWRWNRRRPIVEYVFRVRSVHRGHLRRARNEWIFWARLHVSTTVEKCRDPSRRSGRVGHAARRS